jgi:hypothetical protein
MFKRIAIGAAALGGIHWLYQRLAFFDGPTKSELRSALREDRKGNPGIAENHFHSAFHHSSKKHGHNSVIFSPLNDLMHILGANKVGYVENGPVLPGTRKT